MNAGARGGTGLGRPWRERQKAMSFKIAGSLALQACVKDAQPYLLEPIMDVQVVVPVEHRVERDVVVVAAGHEQHLEGVRSGGGGEGDAGGQEGGEHP